MARAWKEIEAFGQNKTLQRHVPEYTRQAGPWEEQVTRNAAKAVPAPAFLYPLSVDWGSHCSYTPDKEGTVPNKFKHVNAEYPIPPAEL